MNNNYSANSVNQSFSIKIWNFIRYIFDDVDNRIVR